MWVLTARHLALLQDTLMDLLLPDQQRRTLRPSTASEPPKLEIKKDPKGTVTVVGATTLPVTSARELLAAVEQVREAVLTATVERRHITAHMLPKLQQVLSIVWCLCLNRLSESLCICQWCRFHSAQPLIQVDLHCGSFSGLAHCTAGLCDR
jgi:hypothetical protein